MAQHYPPTNGATLEPTGDKWYVDDVSGILVRRGLVIRDRYGRLVNVHDVDLPDRDDLAAAYPLRVESDTWLTR